MKGNLKVGICMERENFINKDKIVEGIWNKGKMKRNEGDEENKIEENIGGFKDLNVSNKEFDASPMKYNIKVSQPEEENPDDFTDSAAVK